MQVKRHFYGRGWFGGCAAAAEDGSAAAAGSAAAPRRPRLVRQPRRGGRGWFGRAAAAASVEPISGDVGLRVIEGDGERGFNDRR
jgi:hypothetical protein